MEQNRYQLTGTVTEIGQTRQLSPFFRKREFKVKFSDTNFKGQMVERVIKTSTINENCDLLEQVRNGDVVEIRWHLEGKDYEKEGKKTNFTEAITYEILVINSPSRNTEEDRNAIVGKNGLEYQEKPATVEDLIRAGAYNKPEDDPLNSQTYKKDSVGRLEEKKKEEPNTGPSTEYDDLPF